MDVLIIGEVRTGMLHHSTAVSPDAASRLLAFVESAPVCRVDRPIAYAISPDVVTGVDCDLPCTTGAKARGVGTIISRVVVTGGRVIQGSAFAEIRPGVAGRRLPWFHYLARPGVVELLSRVETEHLAAGFLSADPARPELLDLGGIGGRAMDGVQASPALDHRPVLKSSRTCLRWTVETSTKARSISLAIHGDWLRTVRLRVPQLGVSAVAGLCEDLALHDWLLTTLLTQVAWARVGTGPRSDVVRRLQPAIDSLFHLWMPAARVDPQLTDLWAALDRQPGGLTHQWRATVDRVRDQLALATVDVLLSPSAATD
ncbi:MAG TPA: SCO2521 family protein [Micromonosporaceae bacterium]|nr:SCO2521 family protein [Micromonosporaceae bacterium]